MITSKLKEKPMMFTSHRLQMLKVTKRIEAIPPEIRTTNDKRILADFETEKKGIITIHNVHEMKMADAAKIADPAPLPKEFVKAPASTNKPADEKPATKKKVKHGKKKKA